MCLKTRRSLTSDRPFRVVRPPNDDRYANAPAHLHPYRCVDGIETAHAKTAHFPTFQLTGTIVERVLAT